MKRHLICSLCALAITGSAFADTVSLNNGDKITGTIAEITEKSVTVETPYAGKLTIDRAAIKTMHSEKTVTVPTAVAGATTQKYISPAPADKGWVETAVYVPPPPPVPPHHTSFLQISPDWKNQFSLGASNTTGNDETTSIVGDLKFHYKKGPDELTLDFNGAYGISNGAQTAGLFDQNAVYRHDIKDRLFAYIDDDARYDAVKGISIQANATAGLGYKLFTGEKFKADIRGGPGIMYQQLFDGTESTDPAFGAGLRLEYIFSDRITSTWDTNYTTSLSDFELWRIHTELAINFKLDFESGLGLKLSVADDYDNQPSAGKQNNDTRTMLSLTLDF